MDPLSRLPLECLQAILQAIADKKNRFYLVHLVTLLRVNRYIAYATLPFLYREPIKALYYVSGKGIRTRTLLRTLLATTPVADLHPALLLEFELDTTSSSEVDSLGLDYIHNIYHLDITSYQFHECMLMTTSKSRIKETDYTLERLDIMPPAFSKDLPNSRQRELVWTLATPILEQLESLSIPLSDIARYRLAIDRLPRLEHVRFVLDVVYDDTPSEGPTNHMSQNDAMQAVVQFVEEHTRVFRGRLKSVQGAHSETGIYLGNTITDDAHRQMYRLLPPIQQPQTISKNNWDQLMVHPWATDLAHVVRICGLTREQWQHAAREGLQILPRCRSLKRLEGSGVGKGDFAWAAKERRRQANFKSGSLGSSNDSQGSLDDDDDATSAIRQVTLPPLEQVSLYGYNPSTDELDDIAFAFSQTLKYLDIIVSEVPGPISFGRGWVELPLLTELVLSGRHSRIVIDPALFTHCPSLTRVDILDATTEYHLQDVDPCLPANLPHLQTVRLVGWSALTFHPATLDSMTATLYLHLCSSLSYIPPMEELKRSYGLKEDDRTETQAAPTPGLVRPRWSWDWHLPLLRNLELKGEPAMMFQFRMLRGCPSLHSLTLRHSRVLSHADFLLPLDLAAATVASTTPSTAGHGALTKHRRGRSNPTHFVVRSLSRLTLSGRWVVDDTLLPHLLTDVLPTVRCVKSEGFTLSSLIQHFRANPKRLNNLDGMELGLAEPTAKEGEFKQDTKFYFHLKKYLLLRDPSVLYRKKRA
ncbi:MAG: LOW QUALITY PROTEIN: hypothetical protein JOS17DRAFT_766172 [Linnemannia elongata]|nr:MAG: LOW QUALITY PROTEIN: hypothetical protein JOS17DRAFT_766172 [Linnemannia elongata]